MGLRTCSAVRSIVCSITERFWWKQLSWEFRWDDWDDEWHACSCWKSQLAAGLAGTEEWMNNKTIDRSQLICVNTARNYIASKLCMHCWARSMQAFAGGSDLRAACIIWWNACDDGIVEMMMMMIESTNQASLPCVRSLAISLAYSSTDPSIANSFLHTHTCTAQTDGLNY